MGSRHRRGGTSTTIIISGAPAAAALPGVAPGRHRRWRCGRRWASRRPSTNLGAPACDLGVGAPAVVHWVGLPTPPPPPSRPLRLDWEGPAAAGAACTGAPPRPPSQQWLRRRQAGRRAGVTGCPQLVGMGMVAITAPLSGGGSSSGGRCRPPLRSPPAGQQSTMTTAPEMRTAVSGLASWWMDGSCLGLRGARQGGSRRLRAGRVATGSGEGGAWPGRILSWSCACRTAAFEFKALSLWVLHRTSSRVHLFFFPPDPDSPHRKQ